LDGEEWRWRKERLFALRLISFAKWGFGIGSSRLEFDAQARLLRRDYIFVLSRDVEKDEEIAKEDFALRRTTARGLHKARRATTMIATCTWSGRRRCESLSK